MEHQEVTNNEHGKKKNQVGISGGRGGGGIAGLLVFGGALAVTGLIAVASFATKKRKAKSPVVEDDTSQGILQDSTTNDENACFETSNISKHQIDSYELRPSQTLILEEKLDLKVKTNKQEESATSLHQEIVLSDDSPPESAVSFSENGIGEEGLESSIDSPYIKAEEEVDKSESEEPLKSVEINKGQYENAATETEEEREDDIVEDDDGDDDVAFETSENSSEATGRTSLDSKEAAIWPAELIEEPQQQVKGEMVNIQSQAEGTAKPNISGSYVSSDSGPDNSEFSEYAGIGGTMASEATLYEKAKLYVALNHQLSVSMLRTWIIPLLLSALLLLVLLTHRIPESS